MQAVMDGLVAVESVNPVPGHLEVFPVEPENDRPAILKGLDLADRVRDLLGRIGFAVLLDLGVSDALAENGALEASEQSPLPTAFNDGEDVVFTGGSSRILRPR